MFDNKLNKRVEVLENYVDWLRQDVKDLERIINNNEDRFNRLMDHLKVREVALPETTIIEETE